MPRIILLPDDLKNKIAAGEVVERPAAVMKELIENSIDAGATAVELEVGQGGRRLLRVSDNGEGMKREDALLCIKRHATSKLCSEEDLFNIMTLGFRGEALPSIASVSRMRIDTAPRGSGSGVSLRVEGGEVGEVREAPSSGTVIEVRDLFFNTPARAKFLKRASTELAHIIDAATRLSLSHPWISFKLKVDGQETMHLPKASGIRERVSQLYGVEFLEGLVESGAEAPGMAMKAFVSRPDNLRRTRANQMLFVNRRAVRDPTLSHAINGAYEGLVLGDRYPMYFLFLELDPGEVDFNVHPTKKEIRFGNGEAVHRFVRRGIMDSLAGRAGPSPSPADETGARPAGADYPFSGPLPPRAAPGVSEAVSLSYRAELPFIYLGETFVAVAEAGGLSIIDHHAAHERILYERLLGGVDLKSSRLLFPRQVRLSRKEHVVVMEHKEMLHQMGIELEDFGHDTVLVRALPEAMDGSDLGGILSDAAEEMLAGGKPGEHLLEAVAARVACHSSIRGKKALSAEWLAALIRDLEKAANPGQCPHGRPTRVSYGIDDLRRIFKRK
jgi:DNA mismatch repair protein MutL